MLKPIIIPTQTVQLFNSNNTLLGLVNEHELNEFRVQIKKHFNNKSYKIPSGYYIIFKEKRIDLYESGRVSVWPECLFDLTETYLGQL